MAIVRKNAVFQVRCHSDDMAAFEASCALLGVKPTDRIRRLMIEDAWVVQKREASRLNWADRLASRASAAADAELRKSRAVASPAADEGPLARKRRMEKEAKDARAKKKANRDD